MLGYGHLNSPQPSFLQGRFRNIKATNSLSTHYINKPCKQRQACAKGPITLPDTCGIGVSLRLLPTILSISLAVSVSQPVKQAR